MIKVNYAHLLAAVDRKKYQNILEEIRRTPWPDFEKTKADLKQIASQVNKYRKYKNVILIGNGGSRTSAWAFYHALFEFRNKTNFEFLASAEPELIRNLRKKYSKKDTLVVAISKSGDNVNAIEPLLNFLDYPVLAITGEKTSALSEMAGRKKWEIILHPEVGGRFSGLTACGLAPAFLMGLPIEEIYAGAESGYRKYNFKINLEKNDALKLAMHLADLEEKKFVEIFTAVYSSALFGFLPLIVQLVHESAGKGGLGQTVYGDYAPESQHHTNQRFFGGLKNAVGLFLGVERSKNDIVLKVPKDLAEVNFSGHPLKVLDGLKASDAMRFDRQGVIGNCVHKKIPAAELLVDEVTPKSMGEFMVFWQYFSVYAALIRGVDPYNQPEVEDSKKISFELRLKM